MCQSNSEDAAHLAGTLCDGAAHLFHKVDLSIRIDSVQVTNHGVQRTKAGADRCSASIVSRLSDVAAYLFH